MRWMMMLAMVSIIATTAIGSAPNAESNLPVDATALDQQMRNLLVEREQTLNDLAEQVQSAPLSERTALDAGYAATQVEYEIRLLELMVQYYEVTGNVDLRERAAESLAQLLAPTPTGSADAASVNRNARSESVEGR